MSPRAQSASMFSSLRVRNYRMFISGSLVSNIGTWMQRIAQDWLVLELSGNSGIALGIVTALQFGPVLLFSAYGGVLADRYPKRRLLLCTQTSMGLLALLLGVLDATGVVALWHVLFIAFGLGTAAAFDAPVRQAFVSDLVGPTNVANAVGLNSATFNGARLIGPAVAGLIIAASSTAPVFFINAGSYVFTIAALTQVRSSDLFSIPRLARARGQLREGIRYVAGRQDLVLPMLLVFIVGTFGLNFQITTALMAKNVFGLGAGAFGLLGSAIAVGSLTGALLSTRRSGRPRQRVLLGAAFAFGVLEVVAGFMPTYGTFAALLVPTGAAALTFTIAANSSVQLGVDPSMRGRVMALYFLCFMGGTPVGAPVVGWIAENFGARSSIVIGGLACILAAVGLGAVLARRGGMWVEPRVHPVPHLHLRLPVPPIEAEPEVSPGLIGDGAQVVAADGAVDDELASDREPARRAG